MGRVELAIVDIEFNNGKTVFALRLKRGQVGTLHDAVGDFIFFYAIHRAIARGIFSRNPTN